MKAETIYRKVRKNLISQPKRAVDPEADVCLYYDENTGLRCAIGGILPLEVAQSIKTLRSSVPSLPFQILDLVLPSDMHRGTGVEFLRELQRAHDNKEHWDEKGFNQKGRDYLTLIYKLCMPKRTSC